MRNYDSKATPRYLLLLRVYSKFQTCITSITKLALLKEVLVTLRHFQVDVSDNRASREFVSRIWKFPALRSKSNEERSAALVARCKFSILKPESALVTSIFGLALLLSSHCTSTLTLLSVSIFTLRLIASSTDEFFCVAPSRRPGKRSWSPEEIVKKVLQLSINYILAM